MAPEAPTLFSTTTLVRSTTDSFSAISRPIASVPAPAAKGTTTRIVRDGNVSACDSVPAMASVAAPSLSRHRRWWDVGERNFMGERIGW